MVTLRSNGGISPAPAVEVYGNRQVVVIVNRYGASSGDDVRYVYPQVGDCSITSRSGYTFSIGTPVPSQVMLSPFPRSNVVVASVGVTVIHTAGPAWAVKGSNTCGSTASHIPRFTIPFAAGVGDIDGTGSCSCRLTWSVMPGINSPTPMSVGMYRRSVPDVGQVTEYSRCSRPSKIRVAGSAASSGVNAVPVAPIPTTSPRFNAFHAHRTPDPLPEVTIGPAAARTVILPPSGS